MTWDSLKVPLQFERRTAEEQATDARQAYTVLQQNRPDGISDGAYRRHLMVLAARMSDTSSSLADLASVMSPPMTKEAFAAQLRRAHNAAGVPITRQPRTHDDLRPR